MRAGSVYVAHMALRTRLAEVLADEGRSQRWLASRAGIHESHLSRIVNGLPPGPDTQAAIAAALDRPVDDLFPDLPQAA